jgi:hypothetical protein
VRFHVVVPSLVAAALASVAAGCAGPRGQRTAAVDPNPSGVYNLVSVDGKSVPCSLEHDGVSIGVHSGVFTIAADEKCTSVITVAGPQGRETTIRREASYTRDGGTLTMQWSGFGATTGVVRGDVFDMINEGVVYSYRK